MSTGKVRLYPPPGGTFVSEWVGKFVQLRYGPRTMSLEPFFGIVMHVTNVTTGAGMTIEAPPCECCGVSKLLYKVGAEDVEIVGVKPPKGAKRGRPQRTDGL